MNVASPCVQVCQLDSTGLCTGCLRTLDEIARWTQIGDPEKSRVIAALAERRGNSTKDKENPEK